MKPTFRIKQASLVRNRDERNPKLCSKYNLEVKDKNGWRKIGSEFMDVYTANNYIHKFMAGKLKDYPRPGYFKSVWTTII